jgi:hypothetical protein
MSVSGDSGNDDRHSDEEINKNDGSLDELEVGNSLELTTDVLEGLVESVSSPSRASGAMASEDRPGDRSNSHIASWAMAGKNKVCLAANDRARLKQLSRNVRSWLERSRQLPVPKDSDLLEQEIRAKVLIKRAARLLKDDDATDKAVSSSVQAQIVKVDAMHDGISLSSALASAVTPPAKVNDTRSGTENDTEVTPQPTELKEDSEFSMAAEGVGAKAPDQADDSADPCVQQRKSSEVIKSALTLAKTKLAKAAMVQAKIKLAMKVQALNAARKQKMLDKDRGTAIARNRRGASTAPVNLSNLSALNSPLSVNGIDAQSDPDRVPFIQPAYNHDEVMDASSIDHIQREGKPAVDDENHLQPLLTIPLPAYLDCTVVAHEPDPEKQEPIPAKPSREEILKRHREAERKKVITVCRNLVAKYEALEASQSARLKETNSALEEARKELNENQRDIEAAKQAVETVRVRKQAVESLIGEYVTKLVDTRRALHDHKTQLEQEQQQGVDFARPSGGAN